MTDKELAQKNVEDYTKKLEEAWEFYDDNILLADGVELKEVRKTIEGYYYQKHYNELYLLGKA